MKGLYSILPPFAPDYSGVCSALFDLGGLVVIHDGGGCIGNFTAYDEPRWYGSTSAVMSSGLREIDAVVGDDEKLLTKIENALTTIHPHFIALVGSPAPMVIGTDFRALGHILSQRTELPILVFDTNGLNTYDHGASDAFLELARRFVKPRLSTHEIGVNIIGLTPLDFGYGLHKERFFTLLTNAGCRIVSCWAMGSSLDEIAASAEARLNIVVSRTGLAAARFLEREQGIPFLVGLPIGSKPTEHFINDVRFLLDLDKTSGMGQPPSSFPVLDTREVLVLGEQVTANAVRNCLRLDLGFSRVTVASFFDMDPWLSEECDIRLEGEDDLITLTQRHPYSVIVGDPLYRGLTASSGKGQFIAFPHIALSSRLYWDDGPSFIGPEGAWYFQEKVRTCANGIRG